MPADKQPLKVPNKILIRTGEIDDSQLPYMMLDGLVASIYPELAEAKIVIGYSYGLKKDQEGKLKLGDIKLCDKFERQLHDKDLKVYINYDFWHHADTHDESRKGLIDHYIWRARPKMDKLLDVPLRDEQGRVVYYLRDYDIEDSSEVVARNGIWIHQLESMAEAMAKAWQEEKNKKRLREGTPEDDPDSPPDQVELDGSVVEG